MWTWLLTLYLLTLTGAAFYSVYLMDSAKDIYDVEIGITGGKKGLLDSLRDAVSFYKYLSYGLIIGNAVVIISMFLLVFKITWRTEPAAIIPAVGGRRR